MDLARTYDMGIAVVMKSILIGEGIEVLDYSGSGHVSVAGVDHSYYVKVRDVHIERARHILSDAGYEKFLIEQSV